MPIFFAYLYKKQGNSLSELENIDEVLTKNFIFNKQFYFPAKVNIHQISWYRFCPLFFDTLGLKNKSYLLKPCEALVINY